MSTQISLRLPDNLLNSAKVYAEANGFGNLQEFIKETIREKIYDEELTKEQYEKIKKISENFDMSKFSEKKKELNKLLELVPN